MADRLSRCGVSTLLPNELTKSAARLSNNKAVCHDFDTCALASRGNVLWGALDAAINYGCNQ